LILATPVVLWGGWPFFVRGSQSILNRSLNMFTLIRLGVAVAYGYSLVGTAFPEIFPSSFRDASGQVGVYFEAAAAITTFVLLGQVLELRARSQTGAAIKVLLGLAPKTPSLMRDDGAEADVPAQRRWRRGPFRHTHVAARRLRGAQAVQPSQAQHDAGSARQT
jgi:Cu+-exporting ATPase